ncbi:MAG: hypothetical protein GWN99_12890 [Gemmatimonadetes bacterium]|nr:hypothetical protein [Gemmatimonadota bacterium]NIS01942.1 hypothetical protein [Gemmatimonadota bacterium]NIT68344.1 hypothetical protein [Gemmatimonadota bacterium]NIV25444.1 hypothetical protein [Gemmatimonadota bacterium]NIW77490.1 hypothetical protein [Gemmatimonadota bacterium]
MREIGRALNVETVLEGSVRKAGDRVRITAQLIDVSDGYHIWSQEYDRRLDDIFAVQDELARSIVDALALAVSLGMDEKRDLYGRRFGLTADRLGDAAESWARLTGIPDPARLRVIGAGVVDSTLRKAALEAVAGLSVEVDREIWYRDGVLAKLWMAYDEFERALDHLERAFAAEDPTLGTIGVDPVWDPVRQDPRYQRIIEALRLPNGHFPDR